jgi:hypothetical protein
VEEWFGPCPGTPVRLRDLNGNFEVLEVDTTKSDKVLTIQFQQTPAEKP